MLEVFLYMRKVLSITLPLIFFSCTKDVGTPKKPAQEVVNFSSQNSSAVSFSATVLPLLQNNCNSCHSAPGSGGINLDSYSSVKQIILSGQLIPVVTNTDVMSTIMPPPPQRHLDSSEINALTLWLNQGCLNN